MTNERVPRKMNAGLMYEILMYLNSFYFGLYATFKMCVSVLKPIYLPYEDSAMIRESGVFLAMCSLETLRIVLGRRSSLSDRVCWQAIASIILTLPSLAVIVYLYYYESYTLKIEVIMSALMIALQGAEFIFACIFICTLCRPVTYT